MIKYFLIIYIFNIAINGFKIKNHIKLKEQSKNLHKIQSKFKLLNKINQIYDKQLIPAPGPIVLSKNVQADQRKDPFEDFEKLDQMPAKYHQDACCIAEDGQPCKIDCVNDSCWKGTIESIYMGFYGVVGGNCPDIHHTWNCVKEVHKVLADHDNTKYNCRDQQSCEINVSGEDFELIPWTTESLNGPNSPNLNHFPDLNGCKNTQKPLRLGIQATCLCLNPNEMDNPDTPPIPFSLKQT